MYSFEPMFPLKTLNWKEINAYIRTYRFKRTSKSRARKLKSKDRTISSIEANTRARNPIFCCLTMQSHAYALFVVNLMLTKEQTVLSFSKTKVTFTNLNVILSTVAQNVDHP